jgi:hypothetical protein
MIFKYAKEISALASILSINQGIKVEEADIVSQKTKCEQLYHDALEDRGIESDYFLLDTEYSNSGQVSELAVGKSRV